VGFNKFSDWTAAERKRIANYVPRKSAAQMNVMEFETNDLPSEVNWIEKGAVNAIAD